MKTANSNGTHLHKRRGEEEKAHNNRTETCVSVPNCMKQCKNRIDPSSQFLIIESCFSFVINDTASEREREEERNTKYSRMVMLTGTQITQIMYERVCVARAHHRAQALWSGEYLYGASLNAVDVEKKVFFFT